MSRSIFENVASLQPGRSVFDLSYEKKFTCDMGQLIPVMCDEVVPGDFFEIGNQAVLRFQPLVAPVLHEINLYVHYFSCLINFYGKTGRTSFPEVLTVRMRLSSLDGLLL